MYYIVQRDLHDDRDSWISQPYEEREDAIEDAAEWNGLGDPYGSSLIYVVVVTVDI